MDNSTSSVSEYTASKPPTSGSVSKSQFPINQSTLPSSSKLKSKPNLVGDSAVSLHQRLSQSLGSLSTLNSGSSRSFTGSLANLKRDGGAPRSKAGRNVSGPSIDGGYSTNGTNTGIATPAPGYTYNVPLSSAGGTSTFGGLNRKNRSLGNQHVLPIRL
jgi:hypothetical protein